MISYGPIFLDQTGAHLHIPKVGSVGLDLSEFNLKQFLIPWYQINAPFFEMKITSFGWLGLYFQRIK